MSAEWQLDIEASSRRLLALGLLPLRYEVYCSQLNRYLREQQVEAEFQAEIGRAVMPNLLQHDWALDLSRRLGWGPELFRLPATCRKALRQLLGGSPETGFLLPFRDLPGRVCGAYRYNARGLRPQLSSIFRRLDQSPMGLWATTETLATKSDTLVFSSILWAIRVQLQHWSQHTAWAHVVARPKQVQPNTVARYRALGSRNWVFCEDAFDAGTLRQVIELDAKMLLMDGSPARRSRRTADWLLEQALPWPQALEEYGHKIDDQQLRSAVVSAEPDWLEARLLNVGRNARRRILAMVESQSGGSVAQHRRAAGSVPLEDIAYEVRTSVSFPNRGTSRRQGLVTYQGAVRPFDAEAAEFEADPGRWLYENVLRAAGCQQPDRLTAVRVEPSTHTVYTGLEDIGWDHRDLALRLPHFYLQPGSSRAFKHPRLTWPGGPGELLPEPVWPAGILPDSVATSWACDQYHNRLWACWLAVAHNLLAPMWGLKPTRFWLQEPLGWRAAVVVKDLGGTASLTCFDDHHGNLISAKCHDLVHVPVSGWPAWIYIHATTGLEEILSVADDTGLSDNCFVRVGIRLTEPPGGYYLRHEGQGNLANAADSDAWLAPARMAMSCFLLHVVAKHHAVPDLAANKCEHLIQYLGKLAGRWSGRGSLFKRSAKLWFKSNHELGESNVTDGCRERTLENPD